jgi:serine/threonine-protein kinase RsbW
LPQIVICQLPEGMQMDAMVHNQPHVKRSGAKKLPKTRIFLSIPSTLGYERLVRATLAPIGRTLGLDAERIADVQTAVCEACINAIEHGNQGQAQLRVRVTLEFTADRLAITVADKGIKPHPAALSSCPTIEQKVAGVAYLRGMGMLLMQSLVDEAGFLPARKGQGNRFRLVIYPPSSATHS